MKSSAGNHRFFLNRPSFQMSAGRKKVGKIKLFLQHKSNPNTPKPGFMSHLMNSIIVKVFDRRMKFRKIEWKLRKTPQVATFVKKSMNSSLKIWRRINDFHTFVFHFSFIIRNLNKFQKQKKSCKQKNWRQFQKLII